MLVLTIKIEAETESGLDVSLSEVVTKIHKGFRSGMDSNDEECYHFDITDDAKQRINTTSS